MSGFMGSVKLKKISKFRFLLMAPNDGLFICSYNCRISYQVWLRNSKHQSMYINETSINNTLYQQLTRIFVSEKSIDAIPIHAMKCRYDVNS